MPRTPEILAPAGQPDAGYAALHYGADAVYLGLSRFSARAEAVNFSPEELAEFTAYAHSLAPRRNVYLALNTLVKQTELASASETLLVASACGVDAVIVQDLGVARLVREHFPSLSLHASTQMAVHNLEGALAVRELGFDRVTVARELTLAELRRLTGESGLEIEAFIHGTLCYSYSGFCLFSSMTTGRSGNRGRCIYTCREGALTPEGKVHPFSLKDMALGERVLDLARAGVASLKIEGRKKSPLYVAATVDYYRRILDGRMAPGDHAAAEARLQTIFARPWTKLFLDGRRNPAAADPETVGHRGSRLGVIERPVRTPAGPGVVFTPAMPVERHDGLQVDIPGEARPYGFPVDNLYAVRGGRMESVFASEPGQTLAVTLPGAAPPLAAGYPLYLASSQAVKRSYPFFRPKPGAFGRVMPVDIEVSLNPEGGEDDGNRRCRIHCRAQTPPPDFPRGLANRAAMKPTAVIHEESVDAFPARDAEGAEKAARAAFQRTGDSEFRAAGWRFVNHGSLFVRPGEWNRIRRAVLAKLAEERDRVAERMRNRLVMQIAGSPSAPKRNAGTVTQWSVCVDSPEHLAEFSREDFAAASEIIVGVATADREQWRDELYRIADVTGREKIRLAIPWLARGREEEAYGGQTMELYENGWHRWFVSGLAGWHMLSRFSGTDLAADWPLFALNRLAADQLRAMGFRSFTVSPEDDAVNMADLLGEFGESAAVTVYSDLPLFLSASCAPANLGDCRLAEKGDAAPCRDAARPMRLQLERSGPVEVWPIACGSLVTGRAFSLSAKITRLAAMGMTLARVDLRWRPRKPGYVLEIWRRVRSGSMAGTLGNFDRGLL